MCSRIKGAVSIGRNLKCVYPIHLFVNWKQDITGDDSILMFVLAFSSKCAWVSGCVLKWFSTERLSPPVSAHHLSGVCAHVGGRCTGAGVLLLLGCQGGPDLPQPAVNPQMWRVGGFYCYSISGRSPPPMLCFMEMSGRSWGRRHWVPGKEFIF